MTNTSAVLRDSQTRLAQEFKSLLNDAEELLRNVSEGGDQSFNNARAQLEKSLGTARRTFESREYAVLDRARHAGRVADEYMHRHPWESIGVAAVIGLLLGAALARK